MTLIRILSISALFLFSFGMKGSHIKGGYITYEHVSASSYQFTITLFSKKSGGINTDSLSYFLSDGFYKTIARDTAIHESDSSTLRSIYKTAPKNLNFGYTTIWVRDQNRIGGILNMDNSTNTAFYMESTILVDPFQGPNNSVQLASPPIFSIHNNAISTTNLTAFDPDGDLLKYELIAPQSDVSTQVINYLLPDSIAVDSLNGSITWNKPTIPSIYSYALKISEYRNGVEIGYTIIDFCVSVTSINSNKVFDGFSNWPTDQNGRFVFHLEPSDTLNLGLTYFDSHADSMTQQVFNGDFESGNNALVSEILTSNPSIYLSFQMVAEAVDVSCTPYTFTFRGKSYHSGDETSNDLAISVYIKDSTINNCPILPNTRISKPELRKELVIWPNPFSTAQHSNLFLKLDQKTQLRTCSVQIIDVLGRRKFNQVYYNKTNLMLNLTHLEAGIYTVLLRSENGILAKQKLIVE